MKYHEIKEKKEHYEENQEQKEEYGRNRYRNLTETIIKLKSK